MFSLESFIGFVKGLPLRLMLEVFAGLVIILGLWYVSNLKANLAISQNNERTLKGAISQQQVLLKEKDNEVQAIQNINNNLSNTVQVQNDSLQNLYNKFNYKANGQRQNLGKIASEKPGLVQDVINNASGEVIRCFELASGAQPTKGEKNSECPNLIK